MDQEIAIISSGQFQELVSTIDSLKKAVETGIKNSSSKIVYSEDEVSKLLHLSPKTLQTYRKEGLIGFVKPKNGRRILYTAEHLNIFLKSNETRAINGKIKNVF